MLHLLQIAVEQLMVCILLITRRTTTIFLFVNGCHFLSLLLLSRPYLQMTLVPSFDADIKTMFTHDAGTKKCCLISSPFCILYMIPVKFRCEFNECSHDAVCLMVYFRFVSWDLVHESLLPHGTCLICDCKFICLLRSLSNIFGVKLDGSPINISIFIISSWKKKWKVMTGSQSKQNTNP